MKPKKMQQFFDNNDNHESLTCTLDIISRYTSHYSNNTLQDVAF